MIVALDQDYKVWMCALGGIQDPVSNILMKDNFTLVKVQVKINNCSIICANFNGLCFGVTLSGVINVWQSILHSGNE